MSPLVRKVIKYNASFWSAVALAAAFCDVPPKRKLSYSLAPLNASFPKSFPWERAKLLRKATFYLSTVVFASRRLGDWRDPRH